MQAVRSLDLHDEHLKPELDAPQAQLMIFSNKHRQEFISLLKPHLPVLTSKARYWTRTQDEADRLLDAFLQRMAGNLDKLRRSDNLRLLLVRELFEDYLGARGGAQDQAETAVLLDKEGILANFLMAREGRMKTPG